MLKTLLVFDKNTTGLDLYLAMIDGYNASVHNQLSTK